MIKRNFWHRKITDSWKERSLVWFAGVRRVGKTTLAKEFGSALYLNCDLPSVQESVKNPEYFYKSLSSAYVIFDEVHQLQNPSQLLKIGSDEFPHIKILATGSSTLSATRKFRDSLTGRKYVVHLMPVLASECRDFGITDIKKRFLHGGLPEALLSDQVNPQFYTEWLDSFYARDIQELFRVDKRHGFLTLVELLFRQSGSLIEITTLSKHAGLSRPTVMNYLEILQQTYAVRLLRPYHRGGRQEILHQPKVYGFDTGFMVFYNGWKELREADCGILWEHLVYDMLITQYSSKSIYFWRDKLKREVDFIYAEDNENIHAIECKWNPDSFEARGIKAFRENYPHGRNYVISPQVLKTYQRDIKGINVIFANHSELSSITSPKN